MNKRRKKLATLGIAACMALAVLASPVSTLPVQAALQDYMVMPLRDAISWEFKIVNNKLYKRLYNHSTCNWIGDWIYVCEVHPNGF